MELASTGLDRAVAVVGAIHAWGDGAAPAGARRPSSGWSACSITSTTASPAWIKKVRSCTATVRRAEAWPGVHAGREPIRSAIRAASTRGIRRLVDVNEAGRRLQVAVVPLSEPGPTGGQVLLVFGKSSMCERLSSYWYGVAKGLTAAEQGVLEDIAQGWSPRDIAERHSVSLSTVRTQIASVREKTGAENIYALLREVAQLPPILTTTAGPGHERARAMARRAQLERRRVPAPAAALRRPAGLRVDEQCGAILVLHRLVARGDVGLDAALPAMQLQLVALLALQNMLSKSTDQHLAARLLGETQEALSAWLDFVCTQGDPSGLAETPIEPTSGNPDDTAGLSHD